MFIIPFPRGETKQWFKMQKARRVKSNISWGSCWGRLIILKNEFLMSVTCGYKNTSLLNFEEYMNKWHRQIETLAISYLFMKVIWASFSICTDKVFRRLHFSLTKEDIEAVASCEPQMIERILKLLKYKVLNLIVLLSFSCTWKIRNHLSFLSDILSLVHVRKWVLTCTQY